jgi:hypothetical protein
LFTVTVGVINQLLIVPALPKVLLKFAAIYDVSGLLRAGKTPAFPTNQEVVPKGDELLSLTQPAGNVEGVLKFSVIIT